MIVLDASALLALLQDEPGSERVERALADAAMSTATLAEVLAKAVDRGLDPASQRQLIEALGIRIEPVTTDDALTSARLRQQDDRDGPVLSLGDRLCLALARRHDTTALTADRAWLDVDHGVTVELVH